MTFCRLSASHRFRPVLCPLETSSSRGRPLEASLPPGPHDDHSVTRFQGFTDRFPTTATAGCPHLTVSGPVFAPRKRPAQSRLTTTSEGQLVHRPYYVLTTDRIPAATNCPLSGTGDLQLDRHAPQPPRVRRCVLAA